MSCVSKNTYTRAREQSVVHVLSNPSLHYQAHQSSRSAKGHEFTLLTWSSLFLLIYVIKPWQ